MQAQSDGVKDPEISQAAPQTVDKNDVPMSSLLSPRSNVSSADSLDPDEEGISAVCLYIYLGFNEEQRKMS